MLEYVSKGGHFTDFGPVPGCKKTLDEVYELAKGDDREAFDRAALDLKLSFQWASHIWAMGHANHDSDIREPGPGVECLQLLAMPLPDKSTIVIGPPGCGKTTWALRVCPKPALLVGHKDDLKQFDRNRHKSIIFDDCNFEHWPPTAQIHIVDQDLPRSIDVKHGKVTIPKNTVKIFTANRYPFLNDDSYEAKAIKRRTKLIEVESLVL